MTDEQIEKLKNDAMVRSEFLEDMEVSSVDVVDLIESYRTLQQQNKQMKEKLEWAARIIDSGMYGGALRYDPLLWFKEYHELIRGGESNA